MVNLEPHSGVDNSYYDVRFSISRKAITGIPCPLSIRIFNKATGIKTPVLAVSDGVINNSGEVIIHSLSKSGNISGLFNLFPNDKMNVAFERFACVDLEFEIEDAQKKKTSFIVKFYNESFSADIDVIPFDLKLSKSTIDFSSCEPLVVNIEATQEIMVPLRIECIETGGDADFFVLTKNGKLSFELPAPFIWTETMVTGDESRFRISYLRRHGVDFNGISTHKPLILANSVFSSTGSLVLAPQTFMGFSSPLDGNFSVSDRFFVPVKSQFSNLNASNVNPLKSRYASLFKFELADLLSQPQDKEEAPKEHVPAKTKENKNFHLNALMANEFRQLAELYRPIHRKVASTARQESDEHKEEDCNCSRKKKKN